MGHHKMIELSIRLSRNLHKRLDMLSNRLGKKKDYVVTEALEAFLEEQEYYYHTSVCCFDPIEEKFIFEEEDEDFLLF